MKKVLGVTSILIIGLLFIFSLDACTVFQRSVGTGWGEGAFDSNGERIYFTATSVRDTRITYSGRPEYDMMMGGGYLACASCHGPDARGGLHAMMGMEVMYAPDIRWDSLVGEAGEEHDDEDEGHDEGDEGHGEGEYDLEQFRMAVVEGKHPDGELLSEDMLRWDMKDEDLEDLAEYLMSLE